MPSQLLVDAIAQRRHEQLHHNELDVKPDVKPLGESPDYGAPASDLMCLVAAQGPSQLLMDTFAQYQQRGQRPQGAYTCAALCSPLY